MKFSYMNRMIVVLAVMRLKAKRTKGSTLHEEVEDGSNVGSDESRCQEYQRQQFT